MDNKQLERLEDRHQNNVANLFSVAFIVFAGMIVLMLMSAYGFGCRPADPVTPGEEDDTSTCQVEAGEPYARELRFYDGCNTDPAPQPIRPDAWYGLALEDMVQVYADFEDVYRYDLVSCNLYYWHLQWIAGGIVYDSVASNIAEPGPFGGVEIVVLWPPEGCSEGSAVPAGNAFQVNNGTSVVGIYADYGVPLE